MEEAGMAARKNLHAKLLKGCTQAPQVRVNSANAGISMDITVNSQSPDSRVRVNY